MLMGSPTANGPSPNNALQRTEAGGGVFSVFHVLRRQPPSLSLSPLGPVSLVAPEHSFVPEHSSVVPEHSSAVPERSVHPFPGQRPSFPRRGPRRSFPATSALLARA